MVNKDQSVQDHNKGVTIALHHICKNLDSRKRGGVARIINNYVSVFSCNQHVLGQTEFVKHDVDI